MMEYVCEVGDIFEYPETGKYEKLRGERIVVLEKGKGCNPDHTYIRVLCFMPSVENDSFHFSCNDRYMDKILEHWRFVGHMDISMITNSEKFTETWSGQTECDVRDKVRTVYCGDVAATVQLKNLKEAITNLNRKFIAMTDEIELLETMVKGLKKKK